MDMVSHQLEDLQPIQTTAPVAQHLVAVMVTTVAMMELGDRDSRALGMQLQEIKQQMMVKMVKVDEEMLTTSAKMPTMELEEVEQDTTSRMSPTEAMGNQHQVVEPDEAVEMVMVVTLTISAPPLQDVLLVAIEIHRLAEL